MGIIAWIVLGLGAGLLANMLIPGRRSQGLILTCVIGIAGALETGLQAVWRGVDCPARSPCSCWMNPGLFRAVSPRTGLARFPGIRLSSD
jgi:hypothetical protein